MPRLWMAAAVSGALLWAVPVTAHASPGGIAVRLHAGAEGSMAEPVAYRRCWRQNGRRHCRWVEGRPRARYAYPRAYGRPRPEELPTGSTAWWRAMDEEGRGGHGHVP